MIEIRTTLPAKEAVSHVAKWLSKAVPKKGDSVEFGKVEVTCLGDNIFAAHECA